MDLIDRYDRASAWAGSKIPAAADKLDAPTPCEGWDVRALLNHLIAGQEIFQSGARGEQVAPPAGMPPNVVGDDPAKQYEGARQATLDAFREPGAAEKAAMLMGIATTDQLVHGWDLAKATGQDGRMPEDLAESAYAMIDGNLPPERRGDFFGPAIEVAGDASAQDRLLAYLGRNPS